MNKQCILLVLTFALLTSCFRTEKKQAVQEKETKIVKTDTTTLKSEPQALNWNELKKYIGTYSNQTDFFDNSIIKNELQRILGSDFKLYQEHISLSGGGEINYKYGLIYGDVSQLHVGGYSSLFFINIRDKKMYLFWLTGRVRDKKFKIYGDKPNPANVLNLIEEEMNICWGHVADFKIKDDSINFLLK